MLAVADVVGQMTRCDETAPALTVLNDNKSAVGAYHRGYSEKLSAYSKAVGLKLRFVRDVCDLGLVELGRIESAADAADGHTKVLERIKYNASREMMGVGPIPEGATDSAKADEWVEITWHHEIPPEAQKQEE